MDREQLIIYRLDELKENLKCLEEKAEIQGLDIASIKAEIRNIKEDIAEIKSANKKNGTKLKRYEYLLALTALGASLVALALAFLKNN